MSRQLVAESQSRQAAASQAVTSRAHVWLTIVLPAVGVLAAALMAWRTGAGRAELALCGVMFVLTFVGVEVGFHRHFTHRSFQTVPALRLLLAALGSMALQGSVIWWAGVHRIHHRHADREGDPHSPLDGFWHAHFGWIFTNVDPPHWRRRAADLFRDEIARHTTRWYYVYALSGLLLPALVLGWLEASWSGAARGLLWGGLVRLFLVNHMIWSVNSVCHTLGQRPYRTRDGSRNNAWLALPSLGFSWHNNHHAHPAAAINAHRAWQIDPCGLFILALRAAGLAWDVRRAPAKAAGEPTAAPADRPTPEKGFA